MIGRVLAGGLRVLHRLGSTPEGPLYQAQYPNGVDVAVLVLPADPADGRSAARARFDLATRIQHPNVAAVYTVGELEDRSVYAVLEQVAGEPLSEAIAGGRAFSLGEAVALIGQVAAGLHAVYRGGFVHGNLSPHAILLAPAADGAPRIKLTGFTPHPALSATAAPVPIPLGTVARYASPERLSGHQPDERSEVYSSATLFHLLLIGLPPDGDRVADAVPGPARAVLVRALAANPDRRFQTLQEFEAALAGLAPAAARPGPVVSLRGHVKRAVVAGLALGTAGVLLLLALQRGALPAMRPPVAADVGSPESVEREAAPTGPTRSRPAVPGAAADTTPAPSAARPHSPAAPPPVSAEPEPSVATKVAAQIARSKAAILEMAHRLSERKPVASDTGAPKPMVSVASPAGGPSSEREARPSPRQSSTTAARAREATRPAPASRAPAEAQGYVSGPTPAADSLLPPRVPRPPDARRSGAPMPPTVAEPRSRAELELDQGLRESIRDVIRLGIVEEVVELRPGSLRVSLTPNAMEVASAEYNLQRLYLAYSAASRYVYGVELDLWRDGAHYGRFTHVGLQGDLESEANGPEP